MLYGYVKKVGNTFEFLSNEGIEVSLVVYNPQFLDASSVDFLLSIGVYRTELIPTPVNALDKDGTYYFNLRADNIVEYRPNYTIGVRIPKSLTPRQVRLILNQYGLRSNVETAIANSNDYNIKDWWEYSLEYDRDNAILVSMATSIGLSNVQLDQMFIDGAKL